MGGVHTRHHNQVSSSRTPMQQRFELLQDTSNLSQSEPKIVEYLESKNHHGLKEVINRATLEDLNKPITDRLITHPDSRLIHLFVAKDESFGLEPYTSRGEAQDILFAFGDRDINNIIPLLQALINRNIDLCIRTRTEFTPLQFAIEQKFKEGCECLLEAGASLFSRDDKETLNYDKLLRLEHDTNMGSIAQTYCYTLTNLAARAYLKLHEKQTKAVVDSHIDTLDNVPPRLKRLLKGEKIPLDRPSFTSI